MNATKLFVTMVIAVLTIGCEQEPPLTTTADGRATAIALAEAAATRDASGPSRSSLTAVQGAVSPETGEAPPAVLADPLESGPGSPEEAVGGVQYEDPQVPVPAAQGGGAGLFVSPSGDDANPGSFSSPFRTIGRATGLARAGDTIYLRGGEYPAVRGGYVFSNTGVTTAPITVANYPGEQAVIRIPGDASIKNTNNYYGFRCWHATDWYTPKSDYVEIRGTDVSSRTLSSGVSSSKGLVFQGEDGALTSSWAIAVNNCEYWEVSGVDFVHVGAAIRTKWAPDGVGHMYVHDNRVYDFMGESGMQFNDDNNRIENNQFYRVYDQFSNPYGCQALNFLGRGNSVRANYLDSGGATIECRGVLFEWERADNNVVEANRIRNLSQGIVFAGGGDNIVRNNLIYSDRPANDDSQSQGVLLYSRPSGDHRWPCDRGANPCESAGNQILNNVIHNYSIGVAFTSVAPSSARVQNNAISEASRAPLFLDSHDGEPLPGHIVADHNATSNFGFLDPGAGDFRLAPDSPLRGAGADLGPVVPTNIEGIPRPSGRGYNIGAY